MAQVTSRAGGGRVELAPEPPHGDVTWSSAFDIDPSTVPLADKLALLADWSGRLGEHDIVSHTSAALLAVSEQTYLADHNGTRATQHRVRLQPQLEALASRTNGFETMRTVAPPVGRGWEYLAGPVRGHWDWDAELAGCPTPGREARRAPSVEPGTYDLVVDPSNLWLTIHESIGHATELDRAVGYEAAYAGTSFATFDQLDPCTTAPPSCTSPGTAPSSTASPPCASTTRASRPSRSTSCATASSSATSSTERSPPPWASRAPTAAPSPTRPCTSRSSAWPTCRSPTPASAARHRRPDRRCRSRHLRRRRQELVHRHAALQLPVHRPALLPHRQGQLAGQLKDVAYQATTTDFWGAMEAVGGASTWVLGGAFNCGKGQPGQVAPVSHGCPSVLVRGVNILNARAESGR